MYPCNEGCEYHIHTGSRFCSDIFGIKGYAVIGDMKIYNHDFQRNKFSSCLGYLKTVASAGFVYVKISKMMDGASSASFVHVLTFHCIFKRGTLALQSSVCHLFHLDSSSSSCGHHCLKIRPTKIVFSEMFLWMASTNR